MAKRGRKLPKIPGMAAVQQAALEWIEREHNGNQTAAAKSIGISQGQLSTIVNHGVATGALALYRLSKVLPKEVASVFGFVVPEIDGVDAPSTPHLDRAITLCEGRASEQALAFARAAARMVEADLKVGEWVEMIEMVDAARRGASEPPTNDDE
jgi:hypothetical protein